MRHTAHMNHQFRIGGRRKATARQRAAVDRGQVAARQRRWGRWHMGGQLAPKVLPTQVLQVLTIWGRGAQQLDHVSPSPVLAIVIFLNLTTGSAPKKYPYQKWRGGGLLVIFRDKASQQLQNPDPRCIYG